MFNSVFLCDSCIGHMQTLRFSYNLISLEAMQAASSKVSLKDHCCGKETGGTAGVAHLLY